MDESGDRLKELCRQATREQDAEKVREIIGEILRLLDERQKTLKKPQNQG
jgi:hypothetical protein